MTYALGKHCSIQLSYEGRFGRAIGPAVPLKITRGCRVAKERSRPSGAEMGIRGQVDLR